MEEVRTGPHKSEWISLKGEDAVKKDLGNGNLCILPYKSVCTISIHKGTLIQTKFGIGKQMSENLVRWMPKSQMPKRFIENRNIKGTRTSARRQRELRSFMRIDGVYNIFTLALVQNFPCG